VGWGRFPLGLPVGFALADFGRALVLAGCFGLPPLRPGVGADFDGVRAPEAGRPPLARLRAVGWFRLRAIGSPVSSRSSQVSVCSRSRLRGVEGSEVPGARDNPSSAR
jgi:hypothetical protein